MSNYLLSGNAKEELVWERKGFRFRRVFSRPFNPAAAGSAARQSTLMPMHHAPLRA